MKEEKEVSFFKKIIICIKDFEKYPEMATKSWKIVLAYFVKLLLVFVVIASLTSVYGLIREFQKELQYVKEELPEFVFENGKLQMEQQEPIVIQNKDNLFSTIIIDTNAVDTETLEKDKQILQKAENGILLLQDEMVIKTQMATQPVTYSYTSFFVNSTMQTYTKQDLLQFFSGTNLLLISIGIFFMMLIYLFVLYFISTWLDIILLALFGFFTALLLRIHLRFSAMCKIVIYSLTLPILLNIGTILIETFTTLRIEYFQMMYIGIAYIYIITAILMIKSDILKSQKELTKIIEEQAKVREELQKQKEQEEEEEQEKQREKQKEEQRKKEKKEQQEKDKNVGNNEPQGENA